MNYVKKWMSLAEVEDKSQARVHDLFVREQFLEACPQDLAAFLREKPLKSLEEVTKAANRFLTARNRQLHVTQLHANGEVSLDSGSATHREGEVKSVKPSGIQCFVCGRYGHKAIDCRDKTKRNCFRCGMAGHEARNCRSNPRAGNTTVKSNCVVQKKDRLDSATEAHGVSTGDLEESTDDGCLLLANGKKVPLISSAVSEELSVNGQCMPVSEGRIGTSGILVLRDTGCSGVIVKQKFILDTQYTGSYGLMQIVDNTVRRVPMATVHVESPYLTGEVSTLCPHDAVYDVIVGNVSGARAAIDPDSEWHMANMVTTRSSAKKVGAATPLNVRPVENWLKINRDKIVEMQGEDVSLQKYYKKIDITKEGLQEVKFEVKDRVLC